ncbi:MAG: flagellar basal body P-ring formation protein FlgA [Burkholderiales bacterium]|nr:flagellar basal body P-ring formation protein FlgA [Burkholderiales bacterium]
MPRIEVELGKLDANLTLAPCQKIEPYLLPGMKPWGRTRIGLRCLLGATRWNVFLPMTVKVFARSLVAATALPAGTVLQDSHLVEQEVDIAASQDAAISKPALALGRALARPLAAGEALRGNDLKLRQWFAAGDIVRVVAVGPGYAVSIDAEAISPGIEGRAARVRTDSGRIISGIPSGERKMEIAL